MRALGEQWIENGRMYKKVLKLKKEMSCYGCVYLDDQCDDCTLVYGEQQCNKNFIIIDLGPVNEEGCLAIPCDKNVFPEIEKANDTVWFAKAQSGTVYMESWGIGRKGAIDAWNRRA
jgi:hypothetical protein